MPTTSRTTLDQGEIASHLWKKIKAHLEQRLVLLRTKNDDPNKDAIATARLRGAIREVKNLAALDNPTLPTEEADSD